MPLRDTLPNGWGPRADRLIRASPYRPMYERALQLTATRRPRTTPCKSVERWLQDNFTLRRARAEPRRAADGLPVQEDKRGYCQQFSGAMALMLRMAGIPARVAAGFSPGSYNKDTRRVPRARPRRPLVGGGLVHRDRLGAVRPDAGALARRGRSRARSPRAPRAADAGEVRQSASGAAALASAPRRRAPRAARAATGLVLAAGAAPRGRRRSAPRRVAIGSAHHAAAAAVAGRARGRAALGAAPRARAARLEPARRRRRCSPSSAGWAGWPARARRPTRARCAPTATTRARPPARAYGSGAQLRRELSRGECARPAPGPDRDPARRVRAR